VKGATNPKYHRTLLLKTHEEYGWDCHRDTEYNIKYFEREKEIRIFDPL
jgi:hypothetical protein